MSWKNLIGSIKEEVNQDSPIIKKSKKQGIPLFEKLARELVDDRIDEIDIKGAVKKVGVVIKTGWQKLTGKIKEVAMRGFKFGVAVGKTVANKFVLFNKAGEILTPPADNAQIKPIASGKKTLTLTYKSKAGPMDIHMGDLLKMGFGTQIDKNGIGIFYVVEPKVAGVQEGIDYKASEILLEDREKEKEELAAMSEIDKLVFGSFSGEGAQALKSSSEMPTKAAPVAVNYDDFQKELNDLLKRVKEGIVLKNSKIKTLAIYAPTGWGKSEIIEHTAKAAGYHYFPIELQKVDINIIQGFPYLEDVEAADDATKEDRLRRAIKIVKIAPSEHLPPSEHPGNWLLFFDEFNRADTEKMSAVMNLLLTGELGGAANLVRDKKTGEKKLDRYRLPEKTVVLLAMNTGMQKNISDAMNAVKDLDIATLERVHRVLQGKYHGPSWFKNFAAKSFIAETKAGHKVPILSRIPPIILHYINQEMRTKTGIDPEKPFLIPVKVAYDEKGESLGGGGERTTSPRAWTIIADTMIEQGIDQWNSLSDESKKKYMKDAEKIKKQIEEKGITDKEGNKVKLPEKVEDYLFAAWVNDARNQVKLLANQSPELGDEGMELIGKMIRSFMRKGREGISDEDVLLNYKAIREQVKNNFTNLGFGTKANLLARLFMALSKFKNEKQVTDYMEDKSIPLLSKQGLIEQLFQTIKALYKDLDFAPDEFASFTHLVEEAAKKGDNELLRSLHQKMAGKWEVYLDNIRKKLQTKSQVEKELEKIAGGKGKAGEKGEEGEEGEKGEEGEEKKNEDIRNFLRGLKL
jgi:hypothetical protein